MTPAEFTEVNQQSQPTKVVEQTLESEEKPKARKENYKFQKSYRQANICSKFFYLYGTKVVRSVSQNEGRLLLENIEDIKSDENETMHKFQKFSKHLNQLIRKRTKDGASMTNT